MPMSRDGFTLIELAVVIIISVILAVSAIIPLTSALNIKLDAAANKFMFDLRFAQQLAINRHNSSGVSLNVAGNSYFVYIGTTSVKAKDPLTRQDLIVNYGTASEYSGVSLVSTNFGDLISFDYMGTPYDSTGTALASQGSVVLQRSGETETVTIEPNTGEVKL